MAGMAAHEERAYSSIYRWVHAQCMQLEPDNAPSVARLRTAIDSLRQRPTLLDYCLRELATCRRQPLRQSFLRLTSTAAATARGGDSALAALHEMLVGTLALIRLEAKASGRARHPPHPTPCRLLVTVVSMPRGETGSSAPAAFPAAPPAACSPLTQPLSHCASASTRSPPLRLQLLSALFAGQSGGDGASAGEAPSLDASEALAIAFEFVAQPMQAAVERLISLPLPLPTLYRAACTLLAHARPVEALLPARPAGVPLSSPSKPAAAHATQLPQEDATEAAHEDGGGGGGGGNADADGLSAEATSVAAAVEALSSAAFSKFHGALQSRLRAIVQSPPRPAATLAAPRALAEPLGLLEELLDAHEAAAAAAAATDADSAAGAGAASAGAAAGTPDSEVLAAQGGRMIASITDPLLQFCAAAAQQATTPGAPNAAGSALGSVLASALAADGGSGEAKLALGERSIFLLNCVEVICSVLSARTSPLALHCLQGPALLPSASPARRLAP